ncbi:hypothetical protein ACF0H5_004464 [Mactra antiquata]
MIEHIIYFVFVNCCIILMLSINLKFCESASPKIKVLKDDSCQSMAEFEWIIFEMADEASNCSIYSGTTDGFSHDDNHELEYYPTMKNGGSFKIPDLIVGINYSVQIRCSTVSSDIFSFNVDDKECPTVSTEGDSSVVVFQEKTSLLGTRDSILGIVVGLFGVTIILVTTFYIVRKVRHRQRLERIRRYLGSSLIDPFENIRDHEPESGSERLIEQNDS